MYYCFNPLNTKDVYCSSDTKDVYIPLFRVLSTNTEASEN